MWPLKGLVIPSKQKIFYGEQVLMKYFYFNPKLPEFRSPKHFIYSVNVISTKIQKKNLEKEKNKTEVLKMCTSLMTHARTWQNIGKHTTWDQRHWWKLIQFLLVFVCMSHAKQPSQSSTRTHKRSWWKNCDIWTNLSA